MWSFETIEHDWMVRMRAERIADGALLRRIRKGRKAGGLDTDGQGLHPVTGTPQGGTVSPGLAKVFLPDVLDVWCEKVVKQHGRGEACLIRYADDGAPRRRKGGLWNDINILEQPCCTRDGGRPSGAGLQEQAPNHLQLQRSRADVVSV